MKFKTTAASKRQTPLSNGPFPLHAFLALPQETALRATPGFGARRDWQDPILALEETPISERNGTHGTAFRALPGPCRVLHATLFRWRPWRLGALDLGGH